MMGVKPLTAQIEGGTATAEGDLGVLQQLASLMITFDVIFGNSICLTVVCFTTRTTDLRLVRSNSDSDVQWKSRLSTSAGR